MLGFVNLKTWGNQSRSTLHIPRLGFVNLKAGGNLFISKTLHSLLPTANFVMSVIVIVVSVVVY